MRPVIRLTIEREELRVELRRFGRIVWQDGLTVSCGQPLISHISELLGHPALKRAKQVDLLLNCPPLQKRLVADLPRVTTRALASMVALQGSRMFRVNGDSLITDAVWIRGGSGQVTGAACAAVDTRVAEEVAESIKGAGFRLRMFSPGGDWARHGLDLRPAVVRRAQRRHHRGATLKLAAVIGLLWLLVAAAKLVALVRDNREVVQALKRLEAPRAAVLAARRSLDSAAGMVRTIEAAQHARWALADQVSWLSLTLPDSAFLTELELWSDGSGFASGWARRPLDVQPVLERAAPGERVQFSSTAARQSTGAGSWEGFSIRLGKGR